MGRYQISLGKFRKMKKSGRSDLPDSDLPDSMESREIFDLLLQSEARADEVPVDTNQ